MQRVEMQRLLMAAVLLLVAGWAHSEDNLGSLTASLEGMQGLLDLEHLLIDSLENYAKDMQDKLAIIRGAVRNMREDNNRSKNDTEKYLGIPLNSFKLVRRLHADWLHWAAFMEKPVGEAHINALRQHFDFLPTSSDLAEAVNGINRLQRVYGLNVADLALGLINRTQYDVSFSALDCAIIGYELYANSKYNEALFWLYAGIQLYEMDAINDVLGFKKLQLMQVYADTMSKLNRFKDAQQVIGVALKDEPHNIDLLRKKAEVEMMLRISTTPPTQVPKPREPLPFERGCRGEFSNRVSRMHCLYNTTTTPFLKLAPLKMEIINLDPFLVVFHDVIYDNEIEDLKRAARPLLKRATVYNEKLDRNEPVPTRTSKFAWLPHGDSNTTIRLNRRISDMTGFSMSGSEMLQVMNYGLGGHYDTHFDFFNVSADTALVRDYGDRVATVLFYMSDVEQGGATCFPNIETAVFPKKGSAVVWYNLNNAMEGDRNTLHAGCPVLVGSKWVVNKWIRVKDQLFRRPCYK